MEDNSKVPPARSSAKSTRRREPCRYRDPKTCKLVAFSAFIGSFAVLELSFGVLFNSLVLLADALHMTSDLAALGISIAATRLTARRHDPAKFSYGMARFEIIGAFGNACFLVAMSFLMMIEAVQRLLEKSELSEPRIVIVVGCVGLFVNTGGMCMFGHGHSHGLPAWCNPFRSRAGPTCEHLHDEEASLINSSSGLSLSRQDSEDQSVNNHGHAHSPREGDDDHDISDHGHSHGHSHSHGGHGHGHGHGHHGGGDTHAHEAGDNSAHAHHDEHSSHGAHGHSHAEDHSGCSGEEHGHSHDHGHDENMYAVFLHVAGDVLGSLGVIASGALNLTVSPDMRFLVDPIITMCVACILGGAALPVLRRCVLVLLHAVPADVDYAFLCEDLRKIPKVVAVDNVHVWSLKSRDYVGSAHLVVEAGHSTHDVVAQARRVFEDFGVRRHTIQADIMSGTS